MLKNLARPDLTAWLDAIGRLHPKEMDLGLERILSVAKPLGWQRFSCPVITVTGTNGKGSCVRFLESIYTAAGHRAGAYTSPHLMAFNERVRVENHPVSDAALITAFETVEHHRKDCSLSFFEYTFLAALQIFQQASLDVLILEVGLGGRLDAVNIVDADIAVITTIDLDHTEWLGPDRESIAKEKAGIFRENRAAICGDPQPPQNLRQMAQQHNVQWHCLDETFYYKQEDGGTWRWHTQGRAYMQLPAITLKHQNAATSLMAIELLQNRLPVAENAVCEGLAQARLPGRFERVEINNGRFGVTCYLDVAHNPQGGQWLAQQWRSVSAKKSGRKFAIVGMLADKDIAGTLSFLLDYVDCWYVSTLSVARGATAQRLHAELEAQGVVHCRQFESVVQALQQVFADAGFDDRVLILGSFYTVAQARQFFLDKGVTL